MRSPLEKDAVLFSLTANRVDSWGGRVIQSARLAQALLTVMVLTL